MANNPNALGVFAPPPGTVTPGGAPATGNFQPQIMPNFGNSFLGFPYQNVYQQFAAATLPGTAGAPYSSGSQYGRWNWANNNNFGLRPNMWPSLFGSQPSQFMPFQPPWAGSGYGFGSNQGPGANPAPGGTAPPPAPASAPGTLPNPMAPQRQIAGYGQPPMPTGGQSFTGVGQQLPPNPAFGPSQSTNYRAAPSGQFSNFTMPGNTQSANTFNYLMQNYGPNAAYNWMGNNYSGADQAALTNQFGKTGLQNLLQQYGPGGGGYSYLKYSNGGNNFSYRDPNTGQLVNVALPRG